MAFRATAGARPFGRAALSGGKRGRPTANTTYQFAGSAERLSPQARQLIAAQRWDEQRGREKPETAPQNRSISSGAQISANRGTYRSERRFAGEQSPFSSGGTAANPFS
jgi:hypothetical protein